MSQLRLSGLLKIGAAASFSALGLLANNITGFPHPERILLIALGMWAVGVATAVLSQRLGLAREASVLVALIVVVMLLRSAPLADRIGVSAAFGAVVVFAVVGGLLLKRIDSPDLLRSISTGVAVFLFALPVVNLVRSIGAYGSDEVLGDHGSLGVELRARPDIFLVVLDGYVGQVAMESEFGVDQPAWVEALSERGFDIPDVAISAYSLTTASIPSYLDMGFPVEVGAKTSIASEGGLFRIVSGSNVLVNTLKDNGYRTTMVESGWSGSKCGSNIDVCVRSPFVDEGVGWLIGESFLGPWARGAAGHPFTSGSLMAMEWTLANAGRISTDNSTDFVFVHVLAPHSPFHLDASCMPRQPDSDRTAARDAYLDQATCINSFMLDLASAVESDDVIVFIADHGSDSRNQVGREPDTWTNADVWERFNILLAIRGVSGCSLDSEEFGPNVFRNVIGCLTGTAAPDLAPRTLAYPSRWLDTWDKVTELEQKGVFAS